MSASASLLTGENRRRVLQALIATTLLALGIAATPGTAHASSLYFTPAEVSVGGGHCTVSGWPHGTIFCPFPIGANFPNRTQEIFGIGLDDAVWTDWGTEAHPSGWKSLGAPTSGCNPTYGISFFYNDSNYGLTVGCVGNNGINYERSRSDGPNGGWGGWG